MKKLFLSALLLFSTVAFAGAVNCHLFADKHNHKWRGVTEKSVGQVPIYLMTLKASPNVIYYSFEPGGACYQWRNVACTEVGDEDVLVGNNGMKGTMYKQTGEINLRDDYNNVQNAYKLY